MLKKDLGNVVTRTEASSDSNYGKLPSERTVRENLSYGLVVLNKPQGPTSHQVADFVKKILHLDKAGHSGTLDPNVTGVLVIALENATRVIGNLLKSGKEYVCLMRMHGDVSEEVVRNTFKEFLGEIEQLPPKKSAVKRQVRTRSIYYLDILEIDERDVLFRVGCEAGTYVRKLCTDIGDKMNTKAHMQELVRTKVANFSFDDWCSLHDLTDAYVALENGDESLMKKILRPIEDAVIHTKKIWLLDSAVDSVCHGAFLSVPGVAKLHESIDLGERVALMTLKDELIGLGVAKMNAQNILRQDKGVAVTETKIFMTRGTYPKQNAKSEN
tara:strand:- start:3346 stop:4329 length:984 start_codon:yes stop_codon:yes gene_type:complete